MYFQHSIKSQFLTGHKPPRKPNFKSKKGAETTLDIKKQHKPTPPRGQAVARGPHEGPTAKCCKVELPPEQKTLAESGQGCYPGKRMSGTIPTSRGGCKHTMKRKMTFYATIWFKSVHSSGYLCKIFIKHNSSKLSFTVLSSALLLSTSLFFFKKKNPQ